MSSDVESMIVVATIVVVAILLCLSGDYIRRRTGGRIRHAEVHLLAWLPALVLELFILHSQGTGALEAPVVFLIPVFVPVVVYSRFFLDRVAYPKSWRRGEERIEAADAAWREAQERRERIEAYKHGKQPEVEPRYGQPGAIIDLRSSVPPSMIQREVAGPDPASVARKSRAGATPTGLRALEGWRLGLAVVLQFLLVVSVALSLVLEFDGLLRMSAPVEPVFFWYAATVAAVSALLVAVLTRGLSFLPPSLAMAASLAGLLASLRVLDASYHSGFVFSVGGRLVAYVAMFGSMSLLLWSVSALLSFSWKRKT